MSAREDIDVLEERAITQKTKEFICRHCIRFVPKFEAGEMRGIELDGVDIVDDE